MHADPAVIAVAYPDMAFLLHNGVVVGIGLLLATFLRRAATTAVLAVVLGFAASFLWRQIMRGAWETYIYGPLFNPQLDFEMLVGLLGNWILPAVLTYCAIRVTKRWKPRIPRYRLRTLLLVLCAISIVCSLVVLFFRGKLDAWRRPRAEKAVAQAIEKRGGHVWWAGRHVTAVYLTDPCLLPRLSAFPRLTTLRLEGTNVGNDHLASLRSSPRLAILSLANTRVSDDGLTHLEVVRSLRHIDLRDTAVSTAGVQTLQDSLGEVLILHR